MEIIEELIPDNEGNHLVVVLNFYDNEQKYHYLQIPEEYCSSIDIADIEIAKLKLDRPLYEKAFNQMCRWLLVQMQNYPKAVFAFICSTQELETNHKKLPSAEYRWKLFEFYFKRGSAELSKLNILSQSIIVGPDGCQTFARVFYRDAHRFIISIVMSHLNSKYTN